MCQLFLVSVKDRGGSAEKIRGYSCVSKIKTGGEKGRIFLCLSRMKAVIALESFGQNEDLSVLEKEKRPSQKVIFQGFWTGPPLRRNRKTNQPILRIMIFLYIPFIRTFFSSVIVKCLLFLRYNSSKFNPISVPNS